MPKPQYQTQEKRDGEEKCQKNARKMPGAKREKNAGEMLAGQLLRPCEHLLVDPQLKG
jgi:hypothetical protein